MTITKENIKKTIINCETGKISFEDFTAEELAQQSKNEIKAKQQFDELVSKKTEKLLLLDKLGITEDEAKLLLG